jgi:lipid-A-disaccharide synthase
MQKSRHVVIIAGEESGDIHASVLIKQLKASYPDIKISGIGGKHMSDAGAELVYDLARFGVTGFTEVIRYLNIIRHAFVAIKEHLRTQKPDLLILVDYPGFNLRLAKFAKRELGIKIIYYISPQIWAWKAKRIHLIKECVDKMAVILPFEKDLYTKAGVPVSFVGHPLIDKIPSHTNVEAIRHQLNLPVDKMIIALMPGSRTNEIERHMPILQRTAILLSKQYSDVHYVIPIARTIKPSNIKQYFSSLVPTVTFIDGKAIECMVASDFVIVASGTASLECALLKKPMCIIYKSSFLTYLIAMSLMKIKFLGLCNILANRMMVPEFLQYDCNAIELSEYIINFHRDISQPGKMIAQLSELKESLSDKQSDCTLYDLVVEEMF